MSNSMNHERCGGRNGGHHGSLCRHGNVNFQFWIFLMLSLVCVDVAEGQCRDQSLCSFMAFEGECEIDPEFMLTTCPKACKNPCLCPGINKDTACDCLLKAKNNYCDDNNSMTDCQSTCTRVTQELCPLLPLPHDPNAVLSTWSTRYLTIVTEVCNEGYEPVDETNQGKKICTSGQRWSEDLFNGGAVECVPVDCGPPPSSPTAFSLATRTTFGSKADYSCKKGFVPFQGQKTLTCNATGLWEGQILICRKVDCGQPVSIPNARVETQDTTFGAKATYICLEGFTADPEVRVVTCNQSGLWNPASPVCSRVDCGKPQVIANTSVSVKDTFYGDTANYTCLAGYRQEHGDTTLTCGATGSWLGSLISCQTSTPIGFDTTLPTLAQTTPAQTTQSDSTVRYTTERVTSYDSTTAATQPSTVSYGTSESTRLPIRNDFECHLTYMDVFLPEELAPNSVLKLRNSSCQLSYNGSHYVTSFSYNECGTTQEYYYTNLILVKNEITVHVKLDKSDSIQFAADYTIPLTCVVRVNSTAVSGSFQVVDRDPFSPQYGHSPDLVLREYANGRYEDEITQYPVKVPINREIFFELAVTQSREDGNGIKIDKCEATPTPDANDTVRYLLISDGCPASPAVRIIPSPGKYRIRFIVQTFHFNVPANQSNLVYVHCYASGCQQFGCYRPCLGFKRRRRSSNHRVSTSIASSGSHIIVPE